MEAKYRSYEYLDGAKRIREILNQSDLDYQEKDSLPSRDDLTFKNGFYSYCSALFIDIRKSSELPNKHTRPVLARLYRAFVSEMVAVFSGDVYVREVNIVGDCVWAVYNTPRQTDIDDVFGRAYTANSMVNILNKELTKRGISNIEVGIGMSYGRALMVKAGYEGSGMNDVVYMGDVVNQAAKLAAQGNKTYSDRTFMVGDILYSNLKDDNKALLAWSSTRQCWHGDVVRTDIDAWMKEQYR
jgi:class 3 adenylate cyclase